MQFTKKGYLLEFVEHQGSITGLLFRCRTQVIWYDIVAPKPSTQIMSDLQIWLPCTKEELRRTLLGWVASYGDAELDAQVDLVVECAWKYVESGPPKSPDSPVKVRN